MVGDFPALKLFCDRFGDQVAGMEPVDQAIIALLIVVALGVAFAFRFRIGPSQEDDAPHRTERQTIASAAQTKEPASSTEGPRAPRKRGGFRNTFGEQHQVDEVAIMIDYLDTGQKATRDRRITVHSIFLIPGTGAPRRATAVNGFCHLRHRSRTFLVDRMVQLADGETGEIVADPAVWLASKALAG